MIDLSPIIPILGTLAGSAYSTSMLLQWLRDAGLDRLTQAMPDRQRNAILRGLLLLLNFALDLGVALLAHYPLSANLLFSVLLLAIGAGSGAHRFYGYVQKGKAGGALDKQYTHIEAPVPQQQ